MFKRLSVMCAVLVFASVPAIAESPYAGEESREVKALSADEIEGYRTGKGMGFAKAAELNHYPGPSHVIKFASDLGLSDERLKEVKILFDTMQKKTSGLGKRLVEMEQTLDLLFKNNEINKERLGSLVRDIAALKGEIRLTHLETHLKMKKILTPMQVMKYDRLRGYTSGGATGRHNPENKHSQE